MMLPLTSPFDINRQGESRNSPQAKAAKAKPAAAAASALQVYYHDALLTSPFYINLESAG
jgi:hypothetical protein